MDKRVYYITKKKHKVKSLTKFVVFSLGMVIVFTITMIIVFCRFQMLPDTLVSCFFAVFGGEVLSCALIKIFRLKSDDTESEDNAYDVDDIS